MERGTTKTRRCTLCKREKPNTSDFFTKTRADCIACRRLKRKAHRDDVAALKKLPENERPLALQDLPSPKDRTPEADVKRAGILAARPAISTSGQTMYEPARITPKQLSAAVVMKAGLDMMHAQADGVLAEFTEILLDREHLGHRWAVELMLDRILPARMYTALGLQVAGVGAGGVKQRPTISINILPANPQADRGRVIEVKALPDPGDEDDRSEDE